MDRRTGRIFIIIAAAAIAALTSSGQAWSRPVANQVHYWFQQTQLLPGNQEQDKILVLERADRLERETFHPQNETSGPVYTLWGEETPSRQATARLVSLWSSSFVFQLARPKVESGSIWQIEGPAGRVIGRHELSRRPLAADDSWRDFEDPWTGNHFLALFRNNQSMALLILDGVEKDEMARIESDPFSGDITYRIETGRLDPLVQTYFKEAHGEFSRYLLDRILLRAVNGPTTSLPFLPPRQLLEKLSPQPLPVEQLRQGYGDYDAALDNLVPIVKILEERDCRLNKQCQTYSPLGLYGQLLNDWAWQARQEGISAKKFRRHLARGFSLDQVLATLSQTGPCLESEFPSFAGVHYGSWTNASKAVPQFRDRAARRLGDSFATRGWAGAVPADCDERGRKAPLSEGAFLVRQVGSGEASPAMQQAQRQELLLHARVAIQRGRPAMISLEERPFLAYRADAKGLWVLDNRASARMNRRGLVLPYDKVEKKITRLVVSQE